MAATNPNYPQATGSGTGLPWQAGPDRGAFNMYGRDLPFNPSLQRMEGLSEGFGGQYGGALQMQQGMFDRYGQMAAGQGPSLAQGQLQQGMLQANQAAAQAAAQARGGNAAGGQMAATQAAISLGGQAAAQAAQIRNMEQMQAMQAQTGLAGQMAGQGLQGQLGMEQLNQGALGMQLDANMTNRQQQMDDRNARIERAKGWKGMFLPDLSDARAKTGIVPTADAGGQSGASTASGVLGALGGKLGSLAPLIALSDSEAKQHIVSGNLSASQAVGALNPYEFEYKAGLGPSGRHMGPMADEVAQVYPGAVQEIGGLKHIDQGRMTGLNTAALSEQIRSNAERDRRLAELEQMIAMGGAAGGTTGDSYSLGGVTSGYG